MTSPVPPHATGAPAAPSAPAPAGHGGQNKLFRAAIWVAIGALVAAAVVCVVWVFVGTGNGLIGRAFLTILLLAGFGGIAILEARLADRRAPWFALVSMASWVLALLIGAFLVWAPSGRFDDGFGGIGRFFFFLLIVLVLQLAVLHIRLYSAYVRSPLAFNRIAAYVTIGLVVALAFLLILPLMLNEWLRFTDLFWRIVVAVTILAAVGTAIVPLVNALLAPRSRVRAPRPVPPQPVYAAQPAVAPGPAPAPQGSAPAGGAPWPTYVDGATPLPYLPDGSPDWAAYYTGRPTGPGARAWARAAAPTAPAAQAPGYEGVRPAPPLPPQA